MLQGLLEKILKNELDDESNLAEIKSFFMMFKKGQFIYPSTIKRKFSLSDEVIYHILESLEREKYLRMYYEVICGFCSKSLGLYEYYSQLEEKTYCDDCEEDSITLKNVKIIYKVIG